MSGRADYQRALDTAGPWQPIATAPVQRAVQVEFANGSHGSGLLYRDEEGEQWSFGSMPEDMLMASETWVPVGWRWLPSSPEYSPIS